MRKLPLYLVLRGGLGNQLFMISTGMQVALLNRRSLRVIPNWYATQSWGDAPLNVVRSYELNRLSSKVFARSKIDQVIQSALFLLFKITWKYGEKATLGFSINTDLIKDKKIHRRTMLIYGSIMINSENLIAIRSEIIELLTMGKFDEENIRREIQGHREEGLRLLAIHVRRGDRVSPYSREGVLSLEYYRNQLTEFDPSNYRFLVFSDDIDWCRKNFTTYNYVFIDESSPLRSLKLMSNCDDFLISLSTFSWWAAWLSTSIDKKVVMPIVNDNDKYRNWNNLFQPGWEKSEARFEKLN